MDGMRCVKGWIRLCRIQPLIVLWQLTRIVDFTFRFGALFLCLRVCMDGCAVVADGYGGGLMGVTGVLGREAERTCGLLDIAHRQRDAVALVVYAYHLDRDVLLQLYHSARVGDKLVGQL